MVLHQNVNIGQRVEVKLHNRIYRGTVKYKGAIIHKPGDWVGVSLEQPGKVFFCHLIYMCCLILTLYQ
jgi:hypothetical protein